MRKKLPIISAALMLAGLLSLGRTQAQVTLTSSPYVEDFDGIEAGLPNGFQVKASATATAMGADGTYESAPANWNNTPGAFKNFASATGSEATSATQASYENRALGVRQTGTMGDAGAAFVFQVANTVGLKDLKLNFKLQSLDIKSPRVATWKVQYGIGANPTTFMDAAAVTGDLTTGGESFKNNDIAVDFGNALDNISDVVTLRVVTLTATTGSGNRPSTGIDDFELSWSPLDPNAPVLATTDASGNNLGALSFPVTALGMTSGQSFVLNGSKLTSDVTIESTGSGFELSLDGESFTNSIVVPASAATSKEVFVRFTPTQNGPATGTIAVSSEGASTINLSLSGVGSDPSITVFDFNTTPNLGAPGDGFSTYSVKGDAQIWTGTTYGNNNTNGVNMNGFASTAQENEDWLISPRIVKTFNHMPVLSYQSRNEFDGPALSVLISTDYDGIGNPNDFTWTDLQGSFPPNNNTWTLTDNIDLSAYKGTPFYIAFKYVSGASLGAARWTLDDIAIKDQTTLFSATPLLNDFGNIAAGQHSAGTQVRIRSVGHGDLTLTAPSGFELSKDDATYGTALTISQADAEAGTSVYVRFAPQTKALSIGGSLHFEGTEDFSSDIVQLKGSSLPQDETFDIAAYNMSFFGSSGSSAIVRTPEEIAAQIENITTVLAHLDADVVSFEEMSSDASLATLLEGLNQRTGKHYQSVVSDEWSHKESSDPSFPPQKIGFIYNADVVSLDPAAPPRAMFNEGYNAGNVYPSDFWASGRLPFMATFIADIQGVKQRVKMVVIHGKAGGDAASYTRRVSDNQVLYDSLATAAYDNDNIIIMGDFNDRLSASITSGQANSSYQVFVDDPSYDKLTYGLDTAGQVSFLGTGDGLIDNVLFRKAPNANPGAALKTMATTDEGVVFIDSSMVIADPRSYVPTYNKVVASDHLPLMGRFLIASPDLSLPIELLDLKAVAVGSSVEISWKTPLEVNGKSFIVERAQDGKNFKTIGVVKAYGNSRLERSYQLKDLAPVEGLNYYRVRSVDANNIQKVSTIVSVSFSGRIHQEDIRILPNPVHGHMQISYTGKSQRLTVFVYDLAGRALIKANGDLNQVNQVVNREMGHLSQGVYLLRLTDEHSQFTTKFIKN